MSKIIFLFFYEENFNYENIIKLKRSNDKVLNDPLNFMIEFITINERNYSIENLFYSEHKRYAFFAFIIQLYHQAGEYNINTNMGYSCVQYFMENHEKLDLDYIFESDVARYLPKDELEIKKSECLLQILRVLEDNQETLEYTEKLLAIHSPL